MLKKLLDLWVCCKVSLNRSIFHVFTIIWLNTFPEMISLIFPKTKLEISFPSWWHYWLRQCEFSTEEWLLIDRGSLFGKWLWRKEILMPALSFRWSLYYTLGIIFYSRFVLFFIFFRDNIQSWRLINCSLGSGLSALFYFCERFRRQGLGSNGAWSFLVWAM